MDKITVVVKEPGKAPEIRQIDNTLKALQDVVGGYIETVTVATDMVIICNEEGLIKHLLPNCRILGCYFVGTILAVGVDGEEFTDVPRPKEVAERLFGEENIGGGKEEDH